MTRRQKTFLALIITQAAHALEEYLGHLYDVFPPARFVSGLISQDRERGFIIFNAALVIFGLWCFLGPLRRASPSAEPLAWLWVGIELINGLGHPLSLLPFIWRTNYVREQPPNKGLKLPGALK